VSAADDASLAASVLAVDPAGLGGVCLRSLPHSARSQWLQMLRDLLPAAAPVRRIPFNIADDRLLGGLDLTATLKANRPVAERGALAAADGGVVVVTMAERLTAHTAGCLNAVLDDGEVVVQRAGIDARDPVRIAIVALDESMADDECVPASLLDRLAFLVDLNGLDLRTPLAPLHDADDIDDARRLLPAVRVPPEIVAALCATAAALGAGSLRVSLLAVRAARAIAALAGRTEVTADEAAAAGRLVLAPRATSLPPSRTNEEQKPGEAQDTTVADETPAPPMSSGAAADERAAPPASSGAAADERPAPPTASEGPEPPAPPASSDETQNGQGDDRQPNAEELQDLVLEAAQAAIPRGLLARLRGMGAGRAPPAAGRVGAMRKGGNRGRPAGVRSGPPRGQARLNVMETLRAAAPWQRLRGRTLDASSRVRIQPGDFRVTRYQQRSPSLTIFAVDASGSAALNRLAEAKGAVELLLADCYVRRDQVAVITFRGRTAELLLPPTRSLVRAKRNLAGLPGGGGTPLAAAIDTAVSLATQSLRRGETPILVMLTDGRANVARDGTGGREGAHADALRAARRLGQSRIGALFIDTSTRPNPLAETLASAMHADYIPLPFANAQALSSVVAAAAARCAR
jgi:magnesium chelatase subunit D